MSYRKHPHADFLAEALKDTSRTIEKKLIWQSDVSWVRVNLYDLLQHSNEWEFRFADTVKPEVTSPLSDDEIAAIWGMAAGTAPEFGREIAIAAKIATICEVAAMRSVTTLTDVELVDLTPMGSSSLSEIRRNVANAAIAEFQQKLLAGMGETK